MVLLEIKKSKTLFHGSFCKKKRDRSKKFVIMLVFISNWASRLITLNQNIYFNLAELVRNTHFFVVLVKNFFFGQKDIPILSYRVKMRVGFNLISALQKGFINVLASVVHKLELYLDLPVHLTFYDVNVELHNFFGVNQNDNNNHNGWI